MYKSIFYLIGEKNRIRFFLLLPVMLLGSLLEMAGVGLLVSICALLMNGERFREMENGTVSVRNRDTAQTETMPLDDFIKKITKEIQERV